MIKNVYKIVLFALAGLVTTANALEIRPFTEILLPAKDNIEWDDHGNKTDIKLKANLAFEVGSELLFYTSYVRYGFGLAFKSPVKNSSFTAAPATIPVWLTAAFGMFNYQSAVQPYAVARLGSLAPLSNKGNWWEEPLNFMVSGGVGAIFPYRIGLEVVYDYASIEKSFKSVNTKFRVSSGRIGIQLSYGFNLTSTSPSQDVNNTWNNESAESSDFNTSESESYFNYSPTPDETPSDTATAEEPAPAIDEPAPDYSAAASETETDTATAEPLAEAATEEPAAEEPAPEPSEPEVLEEPAPEPEAAPAPIEEPKPAAKKPAKKASKKAAKKSSKKSTKKAAKKSKKKK